MMLSGGAGAQTPVSALAPTGTLRAAINFGNPVLAQRGAGGEARGVSVMLASRLAERLGVPLAIVPFESAGGVTAALAQGSYDVAFLAIDPVRGQGLDFTPPYVLIEGVYLVRGTASRETVESLDRPGVRIAVATESAYDLYLTRALKQATLVRWPTGKAAAAAFLAGEDDALAGVKQPLAALAAEYPAHRLVPGRFMSIEQAVAIPKGRDPVALATLIDFVGEMKASGAVARALAESGQADAEVAP